MVSCHLISDLSYIWCHTGVYFHFGWGLQIFMGLYDHPHLRDAHRGDDVLIIFTRISRWSLSGAIQLSPHFSTLRFHHASPSERYLLDLWVWFCYGRGWLGPCIWWQMIWCHLIFRPVTHLMSYWGIFPFRLRFVHPHRFAWSSLAMRYALGWWFDFILSWHSGEPFLSHSVRLILFDIVMILRQSYLRRMDSHITISVEYMLDLLRIPIELFASHQGRPGTSDAILGHISLIQL